MLVQTLFDAMKSLDLLGRIVFGSMMGHVWLFSSSYFDCSGVWFRISVSNSNISVGNVFVCLGPQLTCNEEFFHS